jgi:TadE-like protein
MQSNTNRKSRRGNAVIEVALMAPWIFFLFVGVLDFGFYAYAFISVETAVRAAALLTSQSKTSASDQPDACTLVLNQLQGASSYGVPLSANCGLSAPRFTKPDDCVKKPCLWLNATLVTDSNGDDATRVEVQYVTIGMIPIPGALASSFLIDRVWLMKVNAAADF